MVARGGDAVGGGAGPIQSPSVSQRRTLPPEFLESLVALEEDYLRSDDPIAGSGFHGGAERWEEERRPILEAVHGSGDFLDVGCANGYLLECLVGWAAADGMTLIPHGVDAGPRLVAAARRRLPRFAANLHEGNAWDWEPPRRYHYVYSLWDCVPEEFLGHYVGRLFDRFVEPGGRLILGAYGSRSRGLPPFDVGGFLTAVGLPPVGHTTGGNPPVAGFAWVDR